MKHILKNKLGVTLLEGLIALGLLSLAATATFGVLLSVSRKSSRSDIYEEMLWAVERAHEGLQMYNGLENNDMSYLADRDKGLCAPAQRDANPLEPAVEHNINCMLPPLCDPQQNSSFSYTVELQNMQRIPQALGSSDIDADLFKRKSIRFNITCNGFTLMNRASN